MDAKELRIGNILNFPFTNENVEILGINAYEKNGIIENSISFKNGLNLYCENLSQLKPIPLTEEWLLKLGLEKIGIWTFSLNLVGNLDLIYYLGEKGWSIGLKSYSDFSDLKYAHQLQNLYFALTGEELKIKE